MTVANPRIPYTYDDYCTLPEDMSRRYELLHGDFYMVPAPTTRHQRILSRLNSLFLAQVNGACLGEVYFSPVDVILGQGNAREVVQPDLVFVARERAGIIKLHGIEGPPDLVVEIVSPGTAERDRGYKLTMYARYGIREYWIVDPDLCVVDVYRAGASGYLSPSRYNRDEILMCSLLRDLQVSLTEVFAE